MPTKFCRSMLFKLVELYLWRIERYIRGQQAGFWQLKPYFDSFRCTWRTFGGLVSRKTVANSLAACDSRRLHEENQLRISSSKHFRFYRTKKHFISEWYFPWKPWQLLIFSSLSPGRVKKLQKFINFCLRVGHSANLKHSHMKTTYRPVKGTKS